MLNNDDLRKLGPLKSRAEVEASERARLDAELDAMARAQAAPAPPKSDLRLRHQDQVRRQNASDQARRQAQLSGPGIDNGLAARVEALQARAVEADARQAEWEQQQMNEALGRS